MDVETMDARASYRWAAATGLASVACAAGAEVFERGAVRATETPARIAAYFADNHQALRWQALLFMVSSGFALWFYPTLTHHLARAEGGRARLASTALVAAITSIGLTFVALTLQIGLATASGYAGQPVLLATANALFMVACVPNAVMLTAVTVVSLRAHAIPAWMGWLSAMTALTQVVPVFSVLADTGPLASGGWASAWLPYPLYTVWLVCAAVLLIRAPQTVHHHQVMGASRSALSWAG